MPKPLDGIRVLDLTRLLPGAICTLLLVDMGAEVIKIEAPNGGDYARWMPPLIDGLGVFFHTSNRGKQSIILNLKDEQGQAILHKLVEFADVLIEGFRPGVMQRLNCDYDTLTAINPKLVYCSLSGWGQDGPYADKSGHDMNYLAQMGILGAMAMPQPLGGQIADVGGAYVGVMGILASLLQRHSTGVGAYVDAALSESALPFGLVAWVEALTSGTSSGDGGLTGGSAFYRVYYSQDRQAMALGAIEPKFWANFCNAVEHPEWLDDYTNPARQGDLIRQLSELFKTKTAKEWDSLLGDVDCCFTLVHPPKSLSDDPHAKARQMVGKDDNGIPWMRSPVRLGDDSIPMDSAPQYGEHTDTILKSIGYSDNELTKLKYAGVIE